MKLLFLIPFLLCGCVTRHTDGLWLNPKAIHRHG